MTYKLFQATWTWGPAIICGNQARPHSSAVMYLPGKVLRCGGEHVEVGQTETWVIDFTQTSPAWRSVAPLTFARLNHNLVMLPNGKILAVGGTGLGPLPGSKPRLEAEIFDPATETWTRTEVEMTDPRWYHSTAMLLPDGRVVTAGGDNTLTAQIYRPQYFDIDVAVPVIQSAPSQMQYGQNYTINYTPTAVSITKACLIRLGSVTHGFDQDQRYVLWRFWRKLRAAPLLWHRRHTRISLLRGTTCFSFSKRRAGRANWPLTCGWGPDPHPRPRAPVAPGRERAGTSRLTSVGRAFQ